jgi:PadR family transcriptional regulator PadR
MGFQHMEGRVIDSELKKGTTPLLILALLEHEARHGYELSKLIESRSRGVVTIHAATLYPLLYRMEKQRWIRGRWVEKAGQRRRRYYQLTSEGKQVLAMQRISWAEFAGAISRITGVEYA